MEGFLEMDAVHQPVANFHVISLCVCLIYTYLIAERSLNDALGSVRVAEVILHSECILCVTDYAHSR
jgi:hypothetical protein